VKPSQDAGEPSNPGVNFTPSLPDITNHMATVFRVPGQKFFGWLLSGMASCFISGLTAFGFLQRKILLGAAR
jgi:hypothetical protein